MSASYTAFKCFCPSKKMLMPLKISEPSGTSQSICTRTFRNLTEYLHRNPPEPHRLSAPEPSGTSPGICIGTLQNLTRCTETSGTSRDLHRNPAQPHRPSALKLSETSPGICTGTLRNLNRYLHRNPPEPSGTLPRTWR